MRDMRPAMAIVVALTLMAATGAAGAVRDTHGLQSAAQEPQFVPGEVLVRFKSGVDRMARAAVVQERGPRESSGCGF